MFRQLVIYLKAHPDQIAPFAKKVGIDQQRILGLIEGEEQLSFEQLSSIAARLKVPLTQFLAESNEKINFHFRSNVESVNQLIVNEKVGFLIDSIHPIVSRYTEPSSIPDRQQNEFSQNPGLAARIVRMALLDNDYGRPLLDLAFLLSSRLNVFVIIKDVGADGVSAYIDGYAYIVISPRFAPRMLFTLAHELGHLVLQHHQNALQIDFSHERFFSNSVKNWLESFANAFASSILMPASIIGRTILAIRGGKDEQGIVLGDFDILLISYYFGVSFEVAAMRCEQLELLPRGSARSMYEAVRKDFKSPELRGHSSGADRESQPTFPLAASNNVLYAVFRAIDEGEISASKAANMLGVKLEQLLVLHSQLSDELHN